MKARALVPEGHPIIARRFNAWKDDGRLIRPGGTAEFLPMNGTGRTSADRPEAREAFGRPFGTWFSFPLATRR